ncbi:N-acetylmuramoyl-L-alanine amidase [Novosphingobium sp. TH158]|uniref:peptidoglycan recognition protein family protein n=1 Tax=Novosphingobium sp. TH158 TaxID=2067455 RepID=UPI0013041949|nr:N-acetylmuramoyl-L-alanine amidase [Novosphingobium sp. TH158]
MRKSLVLTLALVIAPVPALAEEIGECRFDRDRLAFAGTPLEQATCLLRKIELFAERKPQPLPKVIAGLMRDGGAPTAAQKAAALAAFPEPYRSYATEHADAPVSQTEEGHPLQYFVIHDTSTPFYEYAPFPRNLNNDPQVNAFQPYMDGTFAREPVAHIFLNRVGQIWAGHEFREGWRATKLESRVVGPRARGRFVHIETVQPRRFVGDATTRARTEGPKPGFTKAQYRMLAALYVYVSARAGKWLIPAQHNTVDAGIPDAHDDPQNFDLKAFGKELERLLR